MKKKYKVEKILVLNKGLNLVPQSNTGATLCDWLTENSGIHLVKSGTIPKGQIGHLMFDLLIFRPKK